MSLEQTLKTLAKHREEILWWEICSLLHDVGKLSDEFLFYRQNWHWMGYFDKDPHERRVEIDQSGNTREKCWLDRDPLLKESRFQQLNQFFRDAIKVNAQIVEGGISVENAVHNHTGTPRDGLVALLKRGDQADSRDDRNYPLFGCEQTDHAIRPDAVDELERDLTKQPEMYRSNVFGYEGEETRIYRGEWDLTQPGEPKLKNRGVLTRAREEFYQELQPLLTRAGGLGPDRFFQIRELMRRYFEPAMSDTTRPNNDTALWEHVYSVATITKALHIQTVLGDPGSPLLRQGVPTRYRLWAFGFDGLRYLSNSHKIGDLLGRRNVLEGIFQQAQQIIEYEIPLGNRVYQDDNLAVFLLPAVSNFESEVEQYLRQRMIATSADLSAGEIVPGFACTEPVEFLTRIVEVIGVLRKQLQVPVREGASELARYFAQNWREIEKARSICAVCRVRPARRETIEDRLVCQTCMDRRRGHTSGFGIGQERSQTPMIDEIVDKNGRAAMIVAEFGLARWLNGDMVRCCFITEPDSIEKTLRAVPYIEDLRSSGEAVEEEPHPYTRMHDEFRQKEYRFLYERDFDFSEKDRLRLNRRPRDKSDEENENRFLDSMRRELGKNPNYVFTQAELLDIVCAKSPTPSTILDVWETTREFLHGIAHPTERFGRSAEEDVLVKEPPLLARLEGLAPQDRYYIEVTEDPRGEFHPHETLRASVDGQAFEVVYEGPGTRRFWIIGEGPSRDWGGRRITLKRENAATPAEMAIAQTDKQEHAFVPYRSISASPDLLLLLVPADEAINVAKLIYGEYLRRFGKVYGRLPFSIGTIFFPRYLPMFSVLDAARRMEENFRQLHECEDGWIDVELPVDPAKLHLRLGTCEADWHHPYIITPGHYTSLPSYFDSMAGPLARIEDLGERRVRIRANYYDYELLGSSAQRFDLQLARDDEFNPLAEPIRRGRHGNGPMLMEQFLRHSLPGSMEEIWDTLKVSGISDASVRNLEFAVTSRAVAWRRSEPEDKADAGALALAAPLVATYFDERKGRVILECIKSGLFQRTLDVYLRILKRRLRQDQQEEGQEDASRSDGEPARTAGLPV